MWPPVLAHAVRLLRSLAAARRAIHRPLPRRQLLALHPRLLLLLVNSVLQSFTNTFMTAINEWKSFPTFFLKVLYRENTHLEQIVKRNVRVNRNIASNFISLLVPLLNVHFIQVLVFTHLR